MTTRQALAVGLIVTALYIGSLGASAALAPNPVASASESASGPLLVGSMGQGYDGSLVSYAPDGDVRWQTAPEDIISFNEPTRLPDGRVLVAFQNKSTYCPNAETECIRTGARIYTEDGERVVWSYSFVVESARNSEVHDVEYVPERGEVVFADMDRERVFAVDLQTKRISWQWNASSFYDAPADVRTTDWLHINDVDHIGDGRYLVSVRNTNQLVILQRGEGVVEVINQGRNPDILDHQHNPQWLGEGRVLVADSENDRVVELQRQPNGTWTVAWTRYRANGMRFDWPRDANRLPNGHTVIQDTRNARLVEIDEDGDVVYAQHLPEQSYAAKVFGTEAEAANISAAPAGSGDAPPTFEQPLAVISVAYGAFRHVVALPSWFGEWHMAGMVVVAWAWIGAGTSVAAERLSDSDSHERVSTAD